MWFPHYHIKKELENHILRVWLFRDAVNNIENTFAEHCSLLRWSIFARLLRFRSSDILAERGLERKEVWPSMVWDGCIEIGIPLKGTTGVLVCDAKGRKNKILIATKACFVLQLFLQMARD